MNIRAQYLYYFIGFLIVTSTVECGFFDNFTAFVIGHEAAAHKASKAVKQHLSAALYDSLGKDTKDLKIRIAEQIKPMQAMENGINDNLASIASAKIKNSAALSDLKQSQGLPPTTMTPLQKALTLQQELLENLETMLNRTKTMIDRIQNTEAPACIAAITNAQRAIENARPAEDADQTIPAATAKP